MFAKFTKDMKATHTILIPTMIDPHFRFMQGVLRDEGYVLMRGRSGAYIADPCEDDRADRAQIELAKMEDGLFELALAHRARGGTWGEFLECAQRQAARAYGAGERSDARTAQASRDAQGENIERAASCEPAFKGGAL